MPDSTDKEAEKRQIRDIVEIEGIGAKYAEQLKKAGIKTTEDLRKVSIMQMSKDLKISEKLLTKWRCMADLFRVKRMAEEYSELAYEMGIKSVEDLSKKDPKKLYQEVTAFAEKAKKKAGWQGDVRKPPTQKDVEIWIESAKSIVKKG
jgi:predicted RecB family nuclease